MLAHFTDGDILVHPKFCSEVQIFPLNNERVFYDKLSRRRIDERIRPILQKTLEGLRLLWKLALKSRFDHWVRVTNAYRRIWKIKRYAPILKSDSFDKLWFYRKGLQKLSGRLYYKCKQAMLEYLRRWKRQVDYDRYLLIHFFGRWNTKVARIVQNKLLAVIFIRLMRPKIRQVELYWKRIAIIKWQAWLKRFYELQLLRQMIRIWRIRVLAIILARRRQKFNALKTLRIYAGERKLYYEKLTNQCIAKLNDRRMKKALGAWLATSRQRQLIMRVLLRCCRSALRRAWLIWTHIIILKIEPPVFEVVRRSSIKSPIRMKSPSRPKTRRKIVRHITSKEDAYRQDTCEYRRVYIRGVTFTTVSVEIKDGEEVPTSSMKIKPKDKSIGKGVSLEDRIKYRLKALHDLDEEYQARHQHS